MILDIFDFDLYLVYLYPIPERLSVESTPIRERGRQIEDSRHTNGFLDSVRNHDRRFSIVCEEYLKARIY